MTRFFEILPGGLAWATIILMVLFSWKLPIFVSIFIILFDIYWLLKTIYLSLHLRSTFSRVKKNMATNWLHELKRLPQDASPIWTDLYHLIIFPMYKEPYEVVRESFSRLLDSNYPKDKFIVVLAIEERGGEEAREVAHRIEAEFTRHFFKFLITEHPADLPGEIPGKGSNETWAGLRVKERVIDPLKLAYEHILVSVFDIDTQVYPEYFGRLSHVFLTAADRLHSMYQPIPLFVNNIYDAPSLARITAFSSTFWQMIQQSRPERLTTFSSQSVPFTVLLDVGFWHKNVVSEDSRIFWQGFLAYHGNFTVEPLAYLISMDANVAPTFWQTLKNVYKQQRRWGWGCENIPYMLEGFRKDPTIPSKKKWYWSWNVLEGFHSWATNSLIIFALGWLPVLIGGKNFNYSLLSYSLPQITRWIMSMSMIGIASSAVLSFLLLPPRPKWFRFRHQLIYILEWVLIPVTLIVFGAIPGLEAQTRLMLGGKYKLDFWVTPKSRRAMSN